MMRTFYEIIKDIANTKCTIIQSKNMYNNTKEYDKKGVCLIGLTIQLEKLEKLNWELEQYKHRTLKRL